MSTSSTAIARSPIKPAAPTGIVDGWEVSTRRSAAALTLCDLTPMTKVVVRAPEDHPGPIGFGRAIRHVGGPLDGVLEVGSGPGEWMWLAVPGTAAELLALVVPGDAFVNAFDLTHGRALIRLTGAHSARLMSKICAIDLADAVTPNLSAFRSSVAKLVTDVVRDDLADGTRSYLLHCERSSGQHLFDCVLDAGAEFDIDVDGWS